MHQVNYITQDFMCIFWNWYRIFFFIAPVYHGNTDRLTATNSITKLTAELNKMTFM